MQTKSREMHLAANWPVSNVQECLDRNECESLVSFLRERYQERFFLPISVLKTAEGNDQGYGMAMMSLCSLLIESIQCLRDGLPSTSRSELKDLSNYSPPPEYEVLEAEWRRADAMSAFESFFTHFESDFPDIDGADFYRNIRCGLLHQAQTKNGWRIRTDEPALCNRNDKVINRNLFAEALEKAFGDYLNELKKKDQPDCDIWKKARRKIYWLIRLSK
jgi:hypothetical protein